MTRLNILIVDDDDADRKMIRRLIDASGLDVTIHEAGCRADMLALRPPVVDAIFLDYRLPDADGLELVTPALDRWPRCAVILVTGQGDEDLAKSAILQGATDYIPKRSLSANAVTRMLENSVQAARLRWQIEEQRTELELFSDTLVHDLKAPIRAVAFFGDQAEEDLNNGDIDAAREAIDFVQRANRQMRNLIDCLADHIRNDRVQVTENVSLSTLVSEATTALTGEIAESDASVAVQNGDLHLRCIRPQIVQLLQNLIGNAIKYAGAARPEISISATAEDGVTHLVVADNGVGIDEGYRTRIFEPFRRIDGTNRPAGTGLGLATCRKIALRHAGHIWCAPDPGGGSQFHVLLGQVPVPISSPPVAAVVPRSHVA
ncbi:sensor histidine kinase [Psychromarinibacter sp. S121]|uniref:sensor histidine kinase n=1 Tax=Psychromarinibacter sp. S121 TaxID=3415127 RepID=UPI003C7B1A97